MTSRLRLRLSAAPVIGALAAAMLAAPPALAMPCVVPSDCTSGFCVNSVCCDAACDSACKACSAATKVSGGDGTCGQAKAGSICAPPRCDGATFAWVGAATCDSSGDCVPPPEQSCLLNDPCKFDLCSDTGCEHVVKLDGTACGTGMVCENGACSMATATSSSSSTSTGASSGASGTGGGGATTGSTSSSAAAGGSGGQGGASAAGGTGGSLYPPVNNGTGCGCRAAGEGPQGGALSLAAAALALLRRRRVRSGSRPGYSARP